MWVRVSVYNLANAPANRLLKSYLSLGGIYHLGIEVCDVEWSYGYCESGSGVFAVEPRHCSLGPFHENVVLGDCNLSADEVIKILHDLASEWIGPDYHILNRNCILFCKVFLSKLGHNLTLPAYTTALLESASGIIGSARTPTKPRCVDESEEKRLMWREAERIMRESERDLKIVSSTHPGIIHGRHISVLAHSVEETRKVCSRSLYRVCQSNHRGYMASPGTRHLVLNFR